MTHRTFSADPRVVGVRRIALLCLICATAACGSDDTSGGSDGVTSSGACALAIQLTGAHPFDSEFDDAMGCATAFSTRPGAYTAFLPTADQDVVISIALPNLEPGVPATATPLPVTIDLADGTQFSPVGCTGDVT